MNRPIKVLSKSNKPSAEPGRVSDGDESSSEATTKTATPIQEIDVGYMFGCNRFGHEARTFKLIDDKDWNIVASEPASESSFFSDGHSAMSVISAIGPKGVGKSSLLNKLARKDAFLTYRTAPESSQGTSINLKHITRGVDIHSTNYRIYLDCQPLLAPSVLEDFLIGRSNSQFSSTSQISDPLTSCHMISLQLATFLIATSDYVILTVNWLIDVHFLKLIASAIMMIGENNVRAKFIIFSEDQDVKDERFIKLIDNCLGRKRVEKFICDVDELYRHITPYTSNKCELYHKDPSIFTGKNWLTSCRRLWTTTIKNSSMFVDYAHQVHHSCYPN